MKKKILSVIVVFTMIVALLPVTAEAKSKDTLYVGNTNVNPLNMDTTEYWVAAESGDNAYVNSGSDSNYLFSVLYNETDGFTLTLNGASITEYYCDGGPDYGIYANANLNLILNGTNYIGENDERPSETVFCRGKLSVSGSGCLNIFAGHDGLSAEEDIIIRSGRLDICSKEVGLSAEKDIIIQSGVVSINAEKKGIRGEKDVIINGGSVSILGNSGISSRDGNVTISGDDTIVSITAKGLDGKDNDYGIITYGESVIIQDATVTVTKLGSNGDAICVASKDESDTKTKQIRIVGSANVSIVDWSGECWKGCGLHSDGFVAIGDSAQVDICAQKFGIYGEKDVYIGYVWNGSDYVASGSPMVKINEESSIRAAEMANSGVDFIAGPGGIVTFTGNVNIYGGAVTAIASGEISRGIYAGEKNVCIYGGVVAAIASGEASHGIYAEEGNVSISGGAITTMGDDKAIGKGAGLLTFPTTSYKYKSSETAEEPSGSYTDGSYTYSSEDKYLKIITIHDMTKASTLNGSFTVKVGDTIVSKAGVGETVTLTATPESGYSFSSWSVYKTGENETVINVTDNVFSMPTYGVTVEAVFSAKVVHNHNKNNKSTRTITVSDTVEDASIFGCGTAGVPYYMDFKGGKVFIGFARKGKYIAPSGVEVLFRDNSRSFEDVCSHWAVDDIDFVTEREIFVGTGANTFSPDMGMTRAMFATVVGRLYERSYAEIEVSDAHAFIDCDYNDYYGKYVDWCTKKGIISGYGNDKFGPDDSISRGQMAALLYRFADFLAVLPEDMDTVLNYPDSASFSSWAVSAALYCQTTGIITGRSGGVFDLNEDATRAEVASIIERFVELVLS